MSNFKEPWRVDEYIGDGGGHCTSLVNADGDEVVRHVCDGEDRIVACVNACEGIETEELNKCKLRLRIPRSFPGKLPLVVGQKSRQAIAILIRQNNHRMFGKIDDQIEDLRIALFDEHGIDFPVNT